MLSSVVFSIPKNCASALFTAAEYISPFLDFIPLQELMNQLKLVLHPDKTFIGYCEDCTEVRFFGVLVYPGGFGDCVEAGGEVC
jgi:hypothetical protein